MALKTEKNITKYILKLQHTDPALFNKVAILLNQEITRMFDMGLEMSNQKDKNIDVNFKLGKNVEDINKERLEDKVSKISGIKQQKGI